MKPLLASLLGVSLLAATSIVDEYGWQWPLDLASRDGSLHRIVLTPEIYEATADPSLRDIDVVNAGGESVPTALFGPDRPAPAGQHRIELPWFALPSTRTPDARQRWRVHTETGPDLRLRRVETEWLDSQAQAPPMTDLLLDASALDAPAIALELHWPAPTAGIDARYRVEYSQDLQTWTFGRDVRLVDLVNAGHRVLQRRVDLPAAAAGRYYRLQALDTGTRIEIETVHAVLASSQADIALEWLELTGTRVEADGQAEVRYVNPGRYPVERIEVLVDLNSASEWSLESRDGDDRPWRQRLEPEAAYRLDDGHGESRSPPRDLRESSRDRQWRLLSRGSARDTPRLRLGYRPETLVFLAQGQPPYALLAGSASAVRAGAPVAQLLSAQRQRLGDAWEPAQATPGTRRELAGERALRQPPPKRDWTTWTLWAVLVLGAAVVAWLAFGLLRRTTRPDP